ncbi:SDR family NAD(P)-dependent oxidoreductase [Clostridium frigidicarnis]|uniref:Phosphopantetheine attachment site n=1 Tax=Clostridium frigidicarnis TaxID=84698 RepID=A0A1I0Y3Y9_9CLOT|nr:SDR family NAD(P)-dependent oxidoreductase [Clostridium frigidicarnis]SFB07617.1 Phosphopantetheine attachment site [Clostridium frigidicarnis]
MENLRFDDFNLNKSEINKSNIKKINKNDIAIIGISAKLPKADNVNDFWKNIRDGVDCISSISDNRADDISSYFRKKTGKINELKFEEGAYLEEIDKFDYKFFKLSPKEASVIDPNQRLFLETSYSVIEDAGYGGKKIRGTKTGVFVGAMCDPEYKRMIAEAEPESLPISVPGNLPAIIASRISYILDLKGPSMVVNTTCSSSLVAVHMACDSIRKGECEIAIAGGVQIYLLPIRQVRLGIESSDSRTKTFDFSSDGTGGGEGVAAILLKPLYKAIKDRDNIYAVIKGSAINQDGSSISLTAPNAVAQEEVISKAWVESGINPETISYIEAHGTGTKLGDPIEVDGLKRAFRRYTKKTQFCAVGSVKTNLGHLDSSAGIVGLIKAVLALKNKMIPPIVHFKRPNPKIKFIESPLYINDILKEWKEGEFPRRCGVSSFGMSGTNCHVVLEEAPEVEGNIVENEFNILTVSAVTKESLINLLKGSKAYIYSMKESNINDVCYTANTGRHHHKHRIAIIGKSKNDFIEKIEALNLEAFENINYGHVYYGKHDVRSKDNGKEGVKYITTDMQNELSNLANDSIRKYIDEKGITDLERLCDFYIKGADVNWELLYSNERNRKLSLPTYPFKKERCWINLSCCDETLEQYDDNFYFKTIWENYEPKQTNNIKLNKKILLLKGRKQKVNDLVYDLKMQEYSVIDVELGKKFKKISNDKYIIENTIDNYSELFKEIDLNNIAYIIHTFTINECEAINTLPEFEQTQDMGVYSLFYMLKALPLSRVSEKINIIILSEFVNKITNSDKCIKPQNATLFGLTKSLIWEYPQINCRCVDIDELTNTSSLTNEIISDSSDYIVAYRNNKRYIEVLDKLNIENRTIDNFTVKEDGVYVITGGLGRIGIEIAKYLASKGNINIILINRTSMPRRLEWNKIISDGCDEKVKKRILDIIEIEKNGSKVECVSVDICEENKFIKVCEEIRNKYKRINGVIHSAGEGVGATGSPICEEDEEIFTKVLLPKVKGTLILNNALKDDKLDFFIMFSSVITLMGGVGSSHYTAANYFLDSLTSFRNNQGMRTITINWPAWDKDNLIKDAKIIEKKQLFNILQPSKAINCFDKVINSTESKVIVGNLNYESDVLELKNLFPFKLSDDLEANLNKYKKISNSIDNKDKCMTMEQEKNNDYSYTGIEKSIADIWQKVLGFNEIDIYDNFFEIGGDSILASRVFTLIDKEYPGKIKLIDLFSYTTVSKLSEFIASKFKCEYVNQNKIENCECKDIEQDDVSDLISKLQNDELNIDEVVNMFNLMEGKDE